MALSGIVEAVWDAYAADVPLIFYLVTTTWLTIRYLNEQKRYRREVGNVLARIDRTLKELAAAQPKTEGEALSPEPGRSPVVGQSSAALAASGEASQSSAIAARA
jgi:hypothetical protein